MAWGCGLVGVAVKADEATGGEFEAGVVRGFAAFFTHDEAADEDDGFGGLGFGEVTFFDFAGAEGELFEVFGEAGGWAGEFDIGGEFGEPLLLVAG
ncbi:MAG: hypothetical protein RI897_4507 [Verrucomicrobiota bacterium]